MTKRLMLVFLILFISNKMALSQDQRVIDSLHNVLENQFAGNRFTVLYEIAFQYINRDNEVALRYIRKAEQAALIGKDSLQILKSKRVQAAILKMLGRPKEALSVVVPLAGSKYLKGFPQEYLRVLNLIGVCYILTSEFDKALKFHFLEYEEAERNRDSSFLSIALGNIGLTYYKLKNYRKAVRFTKEALALQDTAKISYAMLFNASLSYTHLHSFDSARMFLSRMIQMCGIGCRPSWQWNLKYVSGLIHYETKEHQRAEADFLESFRLAKQGGDIRMQLDNVYLLAKMYIQNGDQQNAAKYLRIGEGLIQSGMPFNMEAMKVYSQLAELFLAVENFEKASFYQANYIQLKDSIYNESVTNSLMDIESRHHERRNESRIAEQNQIIFLNERIIDRQKKLNALSVTIIILIVVFVIYLIKGYRKQHELTALLDRKVHERTTQLEVSRRELLRLLRQRERAVMRTSSMICEKIITLKGLSNTAREEICDPLASAYLDKIDNTAKQIDAYVRLIINDSKAVASP